jgi:hypothetical protein
VALIWQATELSELALKKAAQLARLSAAPARFPPEYFSCKSVFVAASQRGLRAPQNA